MALAACASPRRQWQPQAGGAAGTTTAGGQTVSAGGVVASGTPREQLDQLDGVLRGQTFAPTGPAVHGSLQPNGLIAYAINAAPNSCYTLAVFGETPDQNIDMIVLDPYGRPAAHNVRLDNHPWVSFCAGEAGRFIARVQMASGSGGYFYTAYQGPAQRRMELSSFFSEAPAAPTGGGGLQENFALLDADMRARGYESYGEQSTGQLAAGTDRNFDIQLEGGRCYAILAVGDTSVSNLDLHLLDQRGRPVDQDTAEDARPTVRVCPQRSGNFSMRVHMTGGQGGYVYAPYRWPRGTRGAGLEGVSWVRLSEVTALLAVEGYSPDAGFNPGNGQLTRPGASAQHNVELFGGQCYAVVVVGGEGVVDVDVTLSRDGVQLTSDEGSRYAFTSIRQCASSTGLHTVRITAAGGSGTYYYQVFSRSD